MADSEYTSYAHTYISTNMPNMHLKFSIPLLVYTRISIRYTSYTHMHDISILFITIPYLWYNLLEKTYYYLSFQNFFNTGSNDPIIEPIIAVTILKRNAK